MFHKRSHLSSQAGPQTAGSGPLAAHSCGPPLEPLRVGKKKRHDIAIVMDTQEGGMGDHN